MHVQATCACGLSSGVLTTVKYQETVFIESSRRRVVKNLCDVLTSIMFLHSSAFDIFLGGWSDLSTRNESRDAYIHYLSTAIDAFAGLARFGFVSCLHLMPDDLPLIHSSTMHLLHPFGATSEQLRKLGLTKLMVLSVWIPLAIHQLYLTQTIRGSYGILISRGRHLQGITRSVGECLRYLYTRTSRANSSIS